MSKNLAEILRVPQGKLLEDRILQKAASPSLDNLWDPDRALRLIRSNVRGSYLFGRFLVPSYTEHVFGSLWRFPPVDDSLGPLISSIVEVVRGELLNNNVYERPGECHSHYHDALEAYREAGGDMEEINNFLSLNEKVGIRMALQTSPLWSPGSFSYAMHLIDCCRWQLQTFILMAVNEELAPRVYARILKSLSREPRFDKFRQFIERHVEFDSTGHGPVTLEWLDYFIKAANISDNQIEIASAAVLRVLGK